MKLIDLFSSATCVYGSETATSIDENFCDTNEQRHLCKENGGTCETVYDAFIVFCAVSLVIGLAWGFYLHRCIEWLKKVPDKGWIAEVVPKGEGSREEKKDS